jgi:NADPH-dependent curcumin reductase CurA
MGSRPRKNPKAFMGMLEGRNFGKLLIRMRGVGSPE